MAIYFVTGSLGGGKSLCAMSKVDEYLRKGRKIATNMNLYLEHLCGPDNDSTRVIRVPDAPSVQDLSIIGLGSDQPGDNNHGLLVLDELGTWFNARDFADKGRREVIKFCIHLRKRRWDVLFLVQDFAMVDKQMRGNITQYLVTCQRAQDFWMFKLLPKFHIATIRLRSKLHVGTWWYRGTHLYKAYDTEQLYFTTDHGGDDLFVDDELSEREKHYKELNGLYCLLPPKYCGDQVRNEIRERHRRYYRDQKQMWMLMAAVIANVFIWPSALERITWSTPAPAEVAASEDLAQVETALDLSQVGEVAPDQPPTWQEQYGALKITGYARIGMSRRYTFRFPGNPASITDAQLVEQGVRVNPLGREQVELISMETNDVVAVTW